MALFYLHVCNGSGFVEDEEGRDYLDSQSAMNAALEGLRDILAGDLRKGGLNTASFIEIEDQHHELVATISFNDVVEMSREIPANSRPREGGGAGSSR